MAEMQIPVDDPEILEDIVVGALKAMRDIDEVVIRRRWKASEGMRTKTRVLELLGNNGPQYHVIMNTLRYAGVDA